MKKILFNIINPVDTTRYTEFTYLLNFIKNNDLKQMTILDVSSPFMMAYILSSQNKIIKTDVNLD
ncbi:MAG: hypothetical protein OIN89_05750, partial [Candidatus Methanoperedens sp.]|nr:hypothetical protein [Candidatus Methanoperedens sp.]